MKTKPEQNRQEVLPISWSHTGSHSVAGLPLAWCMVRSPSGAGETRALQERGGLQHWVMQPMVTLRVTRVTAKMLPAESPWVPHMGGTDAQGSPTSLCCPSPTLALLAAWGWRCLHCLHVPLSSRASGAEKRAAGASGWGVEQTGAVCCPKLVLQTWLHPFRCLLAPPGLIFHPAL